ncbi:MAG: cell division protein SepF [Candidatus Nanoarchaeia archaeon]|nr:cell division protein SepF [Candidatus Nanoarchaeia archaeon]
MVFSKIKDLLSGSSDFENGNYEDYLEIDTSQAKVQKNKIIVRPFTINEFNDVKPALDAIREGYTVALINIRPLKDKDLVELKRAVNKLKKTCDAIDGDIAGFGEDWVVVTPSFARVYRSQDMSEVEE